MTGMFVASPELREFDVCVVGAGPVGLAVALECERQGLSVLLIEGGKARPRRLRASSSLATILSTATHGGIEQIMQRALGGTTWVWGGRCATFDDIDFEERSYMPHSGWPLNHAHLRPWYALAAEYLDCGDPVFSLPAPPKWCQLAGVSFRSIERLSRRARSGPRLKKKLRKARRLTVSLGETAVGIEPAASGEAVEGLATHDSHGHPFGRRARAYVLACGGLETTRLLLMLQRRRPECFGGDEGPLGRRYMGHLTGTIADLVLADPADFSALSYERDAQGIEFRRQWRIDEAVQRREGLLNIAFWAGNAVLSDPTHCSGALSALYLALRLPFTQHFVSPEFGRANLARSPTGVGPHVANILHSPLQTIAELTGVARERWVERSLKPPLLRSRSGRYILRYHSEQSPQNDSRVRLEDGLGNGGRPRLLIDLRFSRTDAASVVKAHEVLDAALRASGKGQLVYHRHQDERLAHVLQQARDGYHQIGTARMGHSPNDSVVDKDCRVHGFANLFAVGSSVFSTSGQTHPTFPAVALGVRLAAHLARVVLHSTNFEAEDGNMDEFHAAHAAKPSVARAIVAADVTAENPTSPRASAVGIGNDR